MPNTLKLIGFGYYWHYFRIMTKNSNRPWYKGITGTVLLVQLLVPTTGTATGTVPTFNGKGLKFRIEKPEIITKTCIVDSVLFKLKYLC